MAGEKKFPLAVVIRGVDRVSRVIGGIQKRVVSFDNAITSRIRRIDKAGGFSALGKSISNANDKVGELGSKMSGIMKQAGGMALVVAGAAGLIVKSFSDASGEIVDMSDRLGANIEMFQAYRFAAEQAGIDQSAFNGGLSKLSMGLSKAAAGKGNVGKILKALKIDMRGANGEIKDAVTLLPELSEKFKKLSLSQRLLAGQELFGKSGGIKFAMFLKDGAKPLEEMIARARELGLVISEDDARAGEAFGDEMDQAGYAVKGLGFAVAAKVLPTIRKLTDEFTKLVIDMRPRIAEWAKEFSEKLPGRLKSIGKAADSLVSSLRPLVSFATWAVETFGLGNIVLGLFVVRMLALLPAIVEVAKALRTLGLLMLANPWTIWIAGAALAAGAVYLIYKNWGTVSQWLNEKVFFPIFDGLKWLKDGFLGAWQSIITDFSDCITEISDYWTAHSPIALIQKSMTDLIEWVANWQIGEAIGRKIDTIASHLPDWMREKLGISGDIAAPGAGLGAAGLFDDTKKEVRVSVDFSNLPAGAKVTTATKGRPAFDLDQGFAGIGAGAGVSR